MVISLIRIDDRLIHGMVVTRWMSERPCDGVVAVDDASANNPLLSKVLKSAVPQPLKGFVMTVDHCAEKWPEIVASKKNYFLLVKYPDTLLSLYEKGVNFIKERAKLNVGSMSAREGAINVGPNCDVTKQESEVFDKLQELGMEINFKMLPDSKTFSWNDAKKKLPY